jgi:hypothetical protein
MNRPIIFDEYSYAESLLNNGFPTKRISKYDLSYLAKYLRIQSLGFPKIEKKLIELCLIHDPYFNPIVNANRNNLNYALNSCKKYKLKELIPIFITKSEVDILNSVDNQLKRILFTMLVTAKFDKFQDVRIDQTTSAQPFGYYSNYKLETITKFAHVNIGGSKLNAVKYELDHNLKYVSSTLNEKTQSWKINFADDIESPVILINEYSNIFNYLPSFCSVCGKIIFKKGRNHHMCDDCWKDREKEIKRNWWNKNH